MDCPEIWDNKTGAREATIRRLKSSTGLGGQTCVDTCAVQGAVITSEHLAHRRAKHPLSAVVHRGPGVPSSLSRASVKARCWIPAVISKQEGVGHALVPKLDRLFLEQSLVTVAGKAGREC